MTPLLRTPNILFITVDQLRFDCLGCYGNPVINTPNLDRLAREGICFDNAFTAATICVPSRQSMLTGQYPSMHGAKGNGSAIPEGTPTFVSQLRDAGYRTAALGKMHFHPTYADYGFDVMQLSEQLGKGRDEDDYHAYLAQFGLRDKWDEWDQVAEKRLSAPDHYWSSYGGQASAIPEEHYHSTWIADRAIDLIETHDATRPFFTWISFIKPHHPFDPPVPYDQRYSPDEVILPQPRTGWQSKPLLVARGDPRQGFFDTRDMTEADLRRIIALYYGLVEHIDVQIGRVLSTLKDHGLIDNTLIVFTSDHGDYLGQYGLFLKYPNIPYDSIAKVPLIVSGACVSQRDTRVDDLVSLVDLAPTFTRITQSDLVPRCQGIDLSPVFDGKQLDTIRSAVFSEGEHDVKAVITPTHKTIYDRHRHIEEIYDRQKDHHEVDSIAGSARQVAIEHRRLMCDWLIDCCWDRYAKARKQSSVSGLSPCESD